MTFPRILLAIWMLFTLTRAEAQNKIFDTNSLLTNGTFSGDFVNVNGHDFVSKGWTPFVLNGAPTFQQGGTRQPENSWQMIYAPSGTYTAGVYQQLEGKVQTGDLLRFEAQVYLPSNVDGIEKSVGIDPTGGTDAASDQIVWNDTGDGSPWQTLGVTATAIITHVTVFIRVEQPENSLHSMVYMDNATLTRTSKSYVPNIVNTRNAQNPPQWQYAVSGIITGEASCNFTDMRGIITNEAGQPRAGVRVKTWSATDDQIQYISQPSESDGSWRIVLNDKTAINGRWLVAVINDASEIISPVVGKVAFLDSLTDVQSIGLPTHDDCSNGHQRLRINFTERATFPAYTLASVRFLSCMENHGNHHIRVWVIEKDGQQLKNVGVRFREINGFEYQGSTGEKSDKPVGYIEYTTAGGQRWNVNVTTDASDTTNQLSTVTPPIDSTCNGNYMGHYSYEVVFQKR